MDSLFSVFGLYDLYTIRGYAEKFTMPDVNSISLFHRLQTRYFQHILHQKSAISDLDSTTDLTQFDSELSTAPLCSPNLGTIDALLSLLQTACWDPEVFLILSDTLCALVFWQLCIKLTLRDQDAMEMDIEGQNLRRRILSTIDQVARKRFCLDRAQTE